MTQQQLSQIQIIFVAWARDIELGKSNNSMASMSIVGRCLHLLPNLQTINIETTGLQSVTQANFNKLTEDAGAKKLKMRQYVETRTALFTIGTGVASDKLAKPEKLIEKYKVTLTEILSGDKKSGCLRVVFDANENCVRSKLLL